MHRIFHIAFLLLLSLSACKKENDFERLRTEPWSPSIAAPLIDTRSSLEEVLADREGNVNTDANGTIVLQYSKRLFSFQGEDFITLPDLTADIQDSSKTLQFPLSFGRKLETLLLKAGKLEYAFQNPGNEELLLEIELPFAIRNGMPFQQSIVVPPGGDVSGSFDLSGYEFDLTLGGSTFNALRIQHTVTDPATGQDLTGVEPLSIQLRGLLFSYLDGYLGQYDFGLSSDTIPMRFFEQWVKGTVVFTEPSLRLSIDNGFGFPITGELNSVEAYSGNGGAVEPLDPQNSAQDSFSIDFPGPSGIGQERSTGFTFHTGNSGIGNMISIFPEGIRSDLSLRANVAADSSQFNFLLDESELTVDMNLVLPMKGRLDDVLLRDTIAMAKNARDRFDGLKSARFKLLTENELPLELQVQIYLADRKGKVLDSLIQGGGSVLSAAQELEDGSTVPVESRTRIEYERDQGVELQKTERMILEVGLETFDGGQDTVAFKADQQLRIRLGMIAETDPDP